MLTNRIRDRILFIKNNIWSVKADQTTGVTRHIVRVVRIVLLLIRGYRDDDISLQASAITFASVMSLIPILAVVFSILQGIGAGTAQVNRLLTWVSTMPLEFQELTQKIVDIAQSTNFAALGVIGVLSLLLFATMVLNNIERSFNYIWGIRITRNFLKRMVNYISVIVVFPILIALSGTVAAFINSEMVMDSLGALRGFYVFSLRFLPYFMSVIAFFLLYTVIPNTRVRISSAFVGSLAASVAILSWQKVYIAFQVGVARRNAIYGTFASVPIFLTWLYISWVIVLLGAKLCFAMQNEGSIHLDRNAEKANLKSRLILALAVLVRAGHALQSDAVPFEETTFANLHGIPIRLLNSICNQLSAAGWISELADKPGTFSLIRSPDNIKLADVYDSILNHGSAPDQLILHELGQSIQDEMERYDHFLNEAFDGHTLQTLIKSSLNQTE